MAEDASASPRQRSVPTVYAAVYSAVPVWEIRVNGIDVMRRCADNWINSTHLLKVADIDKPQRTKILEREIQTGAHEKVQGGYGKYQGTWVPFDRGVEIAEQFNVRDIVLPILEYKPDTHPTPPRAPPKKLGSLKRGPETKASGSPSPIARRQRKNTMAKDSSGSIIGSPRPVRSHTSHEMLLDDTEDTMYSPSPRERARFRAQHLSASTDSVLQDTVPTSDIDNCSDDNEKFDSPRSRVESNMITRLSRTAVSPSSSEPTHRKDAPSSPVAIRANTSSARTFTPHQISLTVPDFISISLSQWRDQFIRELLDRKAIPLLMARSASAYPMTTSLDARGHSALHWSAALARIDCCRYLINTHKMSTQTITPDGQITILMWAVKFSDNYKLGCFSELLDLLSDDVIKMTDVRGQTVLHHIARIAAESGKYAAAKHYLEVILQRHLRSREARTGTRNVIDEETNQKAFLNTQDNRGNTPLHIFAREGHLDLCSILIHAGADNQLLNKRGQSYEMVCKGYRRNEDEIRKEAQCVLALAQVKQTVKQDYSNLSSDAYFSNSTEAGTESAFADVESDGEDDAKYKSTKTKTSKRLKTESTDQIDSDIGVYDRLLPHITRDNGDDSNFANLDNYQGGIPRYSYSPSANHILSSQNRRKSDATLLDEDTPAATTASITDMTNITLNVSLSTARNHSICTEIFTLLNQLSSQYEQTLQTKAHHIREQQVHMKRILDMMDVTERDLKTRISVTTYASTISTELKQLCAAAGSTILNWMTKCARTWPTPDNMPIDFDNQRNSLLSEQASLLIDVTDCLSKISEAEVLQAAIEALFNGKSLPLIPISSSFGDNKDEDTDGDNNHIEQSSAWLDVTTKQPTVDIALQSEHERKVHLLQTYHSLIALCCGVEESGVQDLLDDLIKLSDVY